MYTCLHTPEIFFFLCYSSSPNQIFALHDYTRGSRFLAPTSHKSSLLQLTGMRPFPKSTLQTLPHIPVELAELLAFCGIGINCVNILVVLFWCVYWPSDCMRVYSAVCLRPIENTDRTRRARSSHRDPLGSFEALGTSNALICC